MLHQHILPLIDDKNSCDASTKNKDSQRQSGYWQNRCLPAAVCQRTNFQFSRWPNKLRQWHWTHFRDNRASRQLCEICHEECKLPVHGSEAIWLYLHSVWCPHTCGAGDGKLTPSSFRVFIVELRRLSCGSFWKSSAHSTISAFSFSHTLEWAYSTKMKNFCSQKETVFPQSLKKHLTHKWCTEIGIK